MSDAIYKKSFSLFLKNTDEKTVIKKFIKQNIPLNKGYIFLDIGGGSGFLAKEISKKVKRTVLIEPNKFFCEKLSNDKKIKVINKKWEDVELKEKFDFILAAYVVTYFPKKEINSLIKKMYNLLSPGGCILILSVDSKKGSWRKIHTYFYKLIGIVHESSDSLLNSVLKKYNFSSKSFITHIYAKDNEEMLKILTFDFHKYPEYFIKYYKKLIAFLKKNTYEDNKVTLEMAHNAYIIYKK